MREFSPADAQRVSDVGKVAGPWREAAGKALGRSIDGAARTRGYQEKMRARHCVGSRRRRRFLHNDVSIRSTDTQGTDTRPSRRAIGVPPRTNRRQPERGLIDVEQKVPISTCTTAASSCLNSEFIVECRYN